MGERIFNQFFPARLFEEAESIPVQINTVSVIGTAGANNAALVAAVTGKAIRVLSLVIASAAAAASYTVLKNGSGGAPLLVANVPANNVATPNTEIKNGPFGIAETSAGVGLYMDTGAGANTYVSIRYITFTLAAA